jgi:hypothetical protein
MGWNDLMKDQAIGRELQRKIEWIHERGKRT